MGSSREESSSPSEAVIATQTVLDALPVGMDSDVLAASPSPDVLRPLRPLSGSPLEAVANLPYYLSGRVGRRSPALVPRWRLAAERSSSSLRSFGAGCAFRKATYRPSDYASPSGEFIIVIITRSPCTLHNQRYGESPDTYNSGTVKARTHIAAVR